MIHLIKSRGLFRRFTVVGLLAVLLLVALACGSAAAPVVIEKQVVVEKEVIKEVPVEVTVIKEVIKIVPRDVIVEKEVIKEVPVEVVKEVIKEVVVEKEIIKEVIKEVVVAPPPAEKKTIVFSDLNWDSAQLQNQIAMYIVKNGYGYPVDTVFGGTIPLQTGLLNGDTQVTMEIWLPNQQDWWDEAIKEASLIPVGKSLDDNWQSSFVVPTYVVEENPGLKTVQDLVQFKDLFVTAESKGKARLVSCLAGWACEKTNADKVAAYGLEDTIELVTPGSAAALFADLEGAYERKEPWLGYLWGPTKTAAELDLTILEEPACAVGAGPETGCAYPTAQVLIAVHPSLISRAPDIIEFLRLWDFDAASQVGVEGWMAEAEATMEQAAVWFLENNTVWTDWVTGDAAANVKDALSKER
ncbi:MAG: hypothetical protein IIB29_09110 [Chloroflexi bacterium]|nr:hypothetical protein [Chloroflexota bacterium]MCI0780972.1 hypothetical protein [Chloroflexota bacterium]